MKLRINQTQFLFFIPNPKFPHKIKYQRGKYFTINIHVKVEETPAILKKDTKKIVIQ